MWVYLLIYVVSGAGTNLALRLLLDKMHAFLFFLVQTACFMYILFTAFFLILECGRKRLRPRVILNREVNKRFLLMALLDCVANYFVIGGAAHTNLALQTLVPQGVIPVSMLLGYFILGSRFSIYQISGALSVLFGVIFTVFSSNHPPFWPTLLFVSNFPLALSALVKELVLQHKSRDLPVSYLNAVVSCLQFLIGFILAPFAGITPGQLSAQFRDGYHCLIGTLSAANPECANGSISEFASFCALLFIMNVSLLFVVKQGSSSILYAASALVLPLSNLANIFPFFMGSSASPLDTGTLIGLISVLIGIYFFATIRPEKRTSPQPPVVYPEADVSLGKGLLGPGEQIFPMEQDMSLIDLASLIPPRGLVGGLGVAPWMPIADENSFIAKWSVTARNRGESVSPVINKQRRGVWIPSVKAEEKEGGFFEWGMQVEHSAHKKFEPV